MSESANRILKTWSSESVEFLLEALGDENFKVRLSSTKVLSSFTDARVAPAIMKRLKLDDNSLVRTEAIKSLGKLEFFGAKKLIFKVKMQDKDSRVSAEAEKVLLKMEGLITREKVLVFFWGPENKDLVQKLSGELRENRLCNLLINSKSFNSKKEAMEEAKKLGATMLITGEVKKESNLKVITVERYNLKENLLIQSFVEKGFEGESQKIYQKITKKVVGKFVE